MTHRNFIKTFNQRPKKVDTATLLANTVLAKVEDGK